MTAEAALLLAAVGLSALAYACHGFGTVTAAGYAMIAALGLTGAVLGLLLLGGAP